MTVHSTESETALRVMNLILVQVRWLIGEQTDYRTLYDILDRIEILPSLLGPEGRFAEFREHVEALAEKYSEFRYAADQFKLEMTATAK
jgi:hypothetical protein